MADRVVGVDVRMMIVNWPQDAPRGAVARFCARYGISRSRFYEIRARVAVEGPVAALQPRPRHKPGRHAQAISEQVEELAVLIRKELADQGWDHGPLSVRHRLKELAVAAPAASTLARVFTRRGMVTAQPQKRPKTAYRRFEFAAVHECWQLDAFQWHLADATQCVIFQLLDDKSRFMIASHATRTESAAGAIAVTTLGIERFQVPRLLLTDNGMAFNRTRLGHRTQLVALLEPLGCKPITGKPAHPQTQGKDERVHQTLQRWLRAHPTPTTLTELETLLTQFDHHYNHHRPHQALHMHTPAHTLRNGPTATPPQPARPTTPRTTHHVTARQRLVGANGTIRLNATTTINLGTPHATTHVTVISTGHTIDVFDTHGTHIHAFTLTPGRTYYGNGQPPGRTPKPNRPH
jgi:putative transposase